VLAYCTCPAVNLAELLEPHQFVKNLQKDRVRHHHLAEAANHIFWTSPLRCSRKWVKQFESVRKFRPAHFIRPV